MGSAVLGEAIGAIRDWSVDARDKSATGAAAFGSLVFNDEVQQKRLPKPVYQALRRTITHGEPLDTSVADAVASAMKDWAVEHGATHYTHWFQPLTGITAEKHDSFLDADRRRQGGARSSRARNCQGRARRVELPVGRHALHLRGARLHGVGSDQPAVAAQQRRRDDAGHPDGVRELDRRGARQEDAAAALDGSAVEAGGPRASSCSARRAERVVTTCGPEQEYFLIDQLLLPVAPRSRSTPAARSSAPSRRRARSSRISTSARSPIA